MPLLYEWLESAVKERGSAGETTTNALVYRDTYVSWRGLVHRVDRRAQDLRALGIGPGTWVGVMLGNVPDFVILALALSKLRAVLVPLDPTTSSRDLDMILEAAPLRALITRPRGGDSVTSAPPLGLRIGARPAPPKFVPETRRRLQGTLLNCHLYRRESPPEGHQDASVVLFTLDGGGDPKGVVRSEAALETIAGSLGGSLSLTPDDRVLCTAPLYHGYGFDFGLLPLLAYRSTLVLDDETVVSRLAKLLRDGAAEVFPATPATYAALARLPTAKKVRIKGARFVSSGSPLSEGVAESFYQRYGVRLLSCYHSTEAGPVAMDTSGKAPATVGKAMSGVEVRVAATNGTALPTGIPGPIWVRSGAAMGSAVPHLAVSAKNGVPVGHLSDDGWFRTGDLGAFDKSGRLLLTGREDDLVKIDGRRVALGEVEGCLESFAQVREAQARLEFDDFAGPHVVVKVVRAGRCKAEDLIDHCARNLAPYKVPRQIEFCEEIA